MKNGIEEGPVSGFSLIEFLIILSATVILLSSVDSWLADYRVRSTVSEALAVAETAKTNIVITCSESPNLGELTGELIVHDFPYSPYVKEIKVSGTCTLPEITLKTTNTGLLEDPVLIISGSLRKSSVTWTCRSTGLEVDAPERCRDR